MRDFIAHPEHGIVWISGASSGIGRALALRLAGEGYKVAVTARSHEKLVELQAEANGLSGSIIVLDGDVTDAEDMEHVMASIEYEHGTLAMAILNAGVCLPVHADDLKRTDFEKSFAVNLSGVVNCLLPAIRHMKAKGQGQIAIVSSVTGYGGLPTGAAYGATKAALINMAESLKFDLDKMGIRIQLVSPGFVDTPATRKNAFPMPALVSVEEAAREIAAGLKSQAFEITFPKRFTAMLKLARLLPYSVYFTLVNRVTGWRDRPPSAGRHPVTPHAAE
ncbi:SDR family NAD(P)-dependent oxidoreductase [Rhizobium leguminosarum]|jgi:NAD(P)-dependent dehydrogenase (short-subunit alcohol dehydrogenase family)|uniref:SDR family NAD(P)-dependent oxidoreductase n=1 Tax=Rhizobium leguminosarum TaxID=384 RepID=UPI001A92E451|nr:SDR family NAD(P)-dependent oxidoreductase [Rhizobium leguminosarum]MBY5552598.1 SDR family NAD(P)-dependent oxidoreductase [Rhizobium leguminosarum]MBY5633941.1 SDR family NAD(P)-dependent oxidoreductase [Rhizobium leguminosarum]MBY5689198.1 SDR family NAD(P)-dependent oxidoreductase [Rhizobium leguminosarum]MBY5724377.1 SDR family NAD(P)-dependent oxidoreductase [Rhizobium leguminosarum]MBY5743657.1 SDR family NAD(P)-dependent oxidoreductase [Rhizobium leguminosarum]